MPATSKAQQRFMGMVHATQKGELTDPSPAVAEAAESMSAADAEDFASTKHKGLPEQKSAAMVATTARRKLALHIARLATPGGKDKQASDNRLLKVARRVYGGQGLLPALSAEYPHLSRATIKQAACRLVVTSPLVAPATAIKTAAPPAEKIVDTKSVGGLLADYLASGLWGGERAGRTQAMATAADDQTTFPVRHPVTSDVLHSLGGAALGGLGGAGLGALLGNLLISHPSPKDLTVSPLIGAGVGSIAGSIAGPLYSARKRRNEMQRVNDVYEQARAQGSLSPKNPQLSLLSAILLPGRGPHRTGQLEATRAIRDNKSIDKQHNAARDVLYSLSSLPYINQVTMPVHGYAQNISTQLRASADRKDRSQKLQARTGQTNKRKQTA